MRLTLYINILLWGCFSVSIHATSQVKILIQEKALEQVRIFQEYCQTIAKKENLDTLRDKTIEAAINLFEPTHKNMEVSSLYATTQTRDIQTYFTRLKNLPYTQVNITTGNIHYSHPLEYSEQKSKQTGEDWYEGIIHVTQKFEGIHLHTPIYTDITLRQVQVFVQKKDSTWIIKLGNIQAKSLDPDSRIREANKSYIAGTKYLDLYLKQYKLNETDQATDEEKMYNALLYVLPHYKNAYFLNSNYRTSIKQKLENNHSSYQDAGIYYFNEKNYLKAYEAFNQYIEITTLPIFTSKKSFFSEEDFIKTHYYLALTAACLEQHEITVQILEKFKDSEYLGSDGYLYLAYGYEKLGDTANLVKTIEKGFEKYPKEPYFLISIINQYILSNRYDEAISYLTTAIKQDQTNPQLLETMGRIYESNMNDLDTAETYYQQALDTDPEYIDALSGMGRVYYNKAVYLLNDANMIHDAYLYQQEVEKAKDLFREALPYYKEIHYKDPENREAIIALRGLYYNLNMGEEFDEMDRKYNPL